MFRTDSRFFFSTQAVRLRPQLRFTIVKALLTCLGRFLKGRYVKAVNASLTQLYLGLRRHVDREPADADRLHLIRYVRYLISIPMGRLVPVQRFADTPGGYHSSDEQPDEYSGRPAVANVPHDISQACSR